MWARSIVWAVGAIPSQIRGVAPAIPRPSGSFRSMKAAGQPLVSFIVTSFNYEKYIGKTIESILNQTVQDIEIIVVDDLSSDGSIAVVKSFDDPRIKLLINDKNMGVSWTNDRAMRRARGKYLALVDSDDWLDPRKTECQLAYFRENPDVSIVGTYVNFVDELGNRHARAAEFEATVNRPHDFNSVDSWIVKNDLNHSSVMLKRQVYRTVGPIDSTMALAWDYDFWMRALSHGFRFGVVAKRLTSYRFHGANATFSNPMESFLEVVHVLQRSVVPLIERQDSIDTLSQMMMWIGKNQQFELFETGRRCSLLGVLLNSAPIHSFAEFKRAID